MEKQNFTSNMAEYPLLLKPRLKLQTLKEIFIFRMYYHTLNWPEYRPLATRGEGKKTRFVQS